MRAKSSPHYQRTSIGDARKVLPPNYQRAGLGVWRRVFIGEWGGKRAWSGRAAVSGREGAPRGDGPGVL